MLRISVTETAATRVRGPVNRDGNQRPAATPSATIRTTTTGPVSSSEKIRLVTGRSNMSLTTAAVCTKTARATGVMAARGMAVVLAEFDERVMSMASLPSV